MKSGRRSRIHHQFPPLAEIEFCIKIREMEKRLFDPLFEQVSTLSEQNPDPSPSDSLNAGSPAEREDIDG